jgi:hypothetical protein
MGLEGERERTWKIVSKIVGNGRGKGWGGRGERERAWKRARKSLGNGEVKGRERREGVCTEDGEQDSRK